MNAGRRDDADFNNERDSCRRGAGSYCRRRTDDDASGETNEKSAFQKRRTVGKTAPRLLDAMTQTRGLRKAACAFLSITEAIDCR